MFKWLFSKKASRRKNNDAPPKSICHNDDIPQETMCDNQHSEPNLELTPNEFEVLTRLPPVYQKGMKFEGIINAYSTNIPALIRKFIEMGLLVPDTHSDYLQRQHIPELKAILKNHNLPVSGNKSILISRIIENIPLKEFDEFVKSNEYTLSKSAISLIKSYKEEQKRLNLIFDSSCVQLISSGKLSEAYHKICYRMTNTAIKSGLGIDWDKELENGIDKNKINILLSLLNYSHEETDLLLANNEKLYNACIVYFILTGKSLGKIVKFYETISNSIIDKHSINALYLRAHYMSSMFSSLMNIAAYKKDGVEKYQILATLDSQTCDVCGNLDGEIYRTDDAQIGVNLPPFHFGCRCTDVPYYDDNDWPGETRVGRDLVTGEDIEVPANMTYKEWKKTYRN